MIFRKTICFAGLALLCSGVMAAAAKGSVIFGTTAVESAGADDSVEFGGAYAGADISLSNEWLTTGGKIYWRLSSAGDFQELGQKLDVKRAYVSVRPFGSALASSFGTGSGAENPFLEISGGKLYSYYLPGNFFQLSETYTGSSRWGKTGVGLRLVYKGFTFGFALPLSESYAAFSEQFAFNIALAYDFSAVLENLPLKFGATLFFDSVRQDDSAYESDFSSTFSANWTPAWEGLISKASLTLSVSVNSEPYVANSVFKNVSNYNSADLKKAHFCSVNFHANVRAVQVVFEGEAGHSSEGSEIPLYAGFQVNVPLAPWLAFRPRLFYYAALNSQEHSESRQTFEWYPRFMFWFGRWGISAGADFAYRQVSAE